MHFELSPCNGCRIRFAVIGPAYIELGALRISVKLVDHYPVRAVVPELIRDERYPDVQYCFHISHIYERSPPRVVMEPDLSYPSCDEQDGYNHQAQCEHPAKSFSPG